MEEEKERIQDGRPAIRAGRQRSQAKPWEVSRKGAHVTHAAMMSRDGWCRGAMERVGLGTYVRLRACRR